MTIRRCLMKKKIFFFLVPVLSILFFSCTATNNREGKIIKFNGDVTVNGQAIEKGRIVRINDLIKTGNSPDSFADIYFYKDYIIRVRNGELRLASESTLELLKGKLFTSFKKLLKDDSLTVDTPTAVLGVRGTKFFTEEKPNETYLCVCEGVVSGHTKNNPGLQKDIPAGYDLHLFAQKDLTDPVLSPDMIKMVNQEFSDLLK